MERARGLKLRTALLCLAGSGLCFLAGWNMVTLQSPVRDKIPSIKNPGTAGNAASSSPSGEGRPGSSLAGGGTFAALMAMETEAARLKPEDWPRLWRQRMRTREHYGLIRKWVEVDPRGALKAALAAAGEPSLSSQEGYDFQSLGRAAINELFSRDPAEALRAMKDFKETYGEYPGLDCLHLLVTGDAAQRAALVDLLRRDGPEKVSAGTTGDALNVLEALSRPGMPARPDIQGGIVWENIQTQPRETVDWILKQEQPLNPLLMERALNGLRSAQPLESSKEKMEAMGRLLERAPAHKVDEYAEEFTYLKAAFDPEGARQWAEDHVPEARLKQVRENLAK